MSKFKAALFFMAIATLHLAVAPLSAAVHKMGTAPAGITATVGTMKIFESDMIQKKKSYGQYVMYDIFPNRAELDALGGAKAISQVVAAIAEQIVFKKLTSTPGVKVVVVEFPELDEYGERDWSALKTLQSYWAVPSLEGAVVIPWSKRKKEK